MELTETIESLNRQLADLYGVDIVTGLPIWRIVWSEDQLEKRLGTYHDFTPSGLYIRTVTEVREVPKYRQWIRQKYVLERLSIIPEMQQNELPTSKISYEPIWVFQDKNGNYLPPKLSVAKFVIDCVYAALGKTSLAKYKDNPIEETEKSIQEIYEYLYGNETDITDKLRWKEAVFIPRKEEPCNSC
ncbi:MAG: hypothetical protein QXE45_04455 [Thermoplasmata archaeon]